MTGLVVVLMSAGCNESSTNTSIGQPPESRQEDAASIRFSDSLGEAFSEARHSNRRVLVYFTGPSCLWCRVMENKTHSDPAVIELASRFVCVKVDITQSPGIQEDYGVFSVPRTIVLTADNERVSECNGYEPADQHTGRLHSIRPRCRTQTLIWRMLVRSARPRTPRILCFGLSIIQKAPHQSHHTTNTRSCCLF